MGNQIGQTICPNIASESAPINLGNDDESVDGVFKIVTEGYLILIIGIVGLFGNGASLWTFSRQKIHRTLHNRLLVLTIYDAVSYSQKFDNFLNNTMHPCSFLIYASTTHLGETRV